MVVPFCLRSTPASASVWEQPGPLSSGRKTGLYSLAWPIHFPKVPGCLPKAAKKTCGEQSNRREGTLSRGLRTLVSSPKMKWEHQSLEPHQRKARCPEAELYLRTLHSGGGDTASRVSCPEWPSWEPLSTKKVRCFRPGGAEPLPSTLLPRPW